MKSKTNATKRLLSLALTLLLVFSALPFSVLPQLSAQAATTYSVGDTLEFGSYPQTKVEDDELISALNACEGDWISYGYYSGNGQAGSMVSGDYMKYKDVTYNGNRYRAVTFSAYRPINVFTKSNATNSYQDNNGYTIGNIYWFKYEPITWMVLDPNTGLIRCKNIIDTQPFSDTVYDGGMDTQRGNNAKKVCKDSACLIYANNYPQSSIRQWLNADFYNTAFNISERNIIYTTELENKCYDGTFSYYDSENTNDKVFLLTYWDAKNTAYGFPSDSEANSLRKATASDYAKSQGYNNQGYFLRSAGDFTYRSNCIDEKGCASTGASVYFTNGVCPALTINLKALKCKHNFSAVVTNPTCTTKGYTTYTCTICTGSYTDAQTNEVPHSYTGYVAEDTPATCTENRKDIYCCANCPATTVKEIENSKLAHSYTVYVAENTPATCTTNRKDTYKCATCTATTVKEIAGTAHHTSPLQKTEASDGTCLVKGNMAYYYCASCNKYFSDADGKIAITLADTVTDYAAHALTHKDAVAATCYANGVKAYDKCTVCNKLFVESVEVTENDLVLNATGEHTWGEWNAENGTHTCTTEGCGAIEICTHGDTAKGETCATCGYTVPNTTSELTFWEKVVAFVKSLITVIMLFLVPGGVYVVK